jgi:tRNA dimethylallyltransferase
VANGANPSSKLPIVVAGPTGVGKTAFAVDLANELDGEIIGADAYQVYRGLEILTGQPTPEMLSAVPHHLIGFLPPTELFDAARFATIVRERISEVLSRGKVPIVTGGSGLYIKALTHGLADVPPADPALRSELASLSPRQLQERLAKIDPAARIDFQNPRRVLRALEISILTGRPASEMRRGWEGKTALGFRGLLLVRERTELQARIAGNVRGMFERGVVAEVGKIKAIGATAAMAIGAEKSQRPSASLRSRERPAGTPKDN